MPLLLVVLLAVYVMATALYLRYVARWEERLQKAGRWTLIVAGVVHTVLLAAVVLDHGRLGLALGDAVLLGASWLVVCGYLFGSSLRAMPLSGPILAPVVTVLVGAVTARRVWPVEAPPEQVMGVVKPIHISLSVLGFFAFGAAFVLAAVYLMKEYGLRNRSLRGRKLPSLQELERLGLRCIIGGFPLYTAGLVLGGITASGGTGAAIVGPQYLLSVVSWIIYAFVLQTRLTIGWQGRRAAIATMVAFLPTLGTVLLYALRGAA